MGEIWAEDIRPSADAMPLRGDRAYFAAMAQRGEPMKPLGRACHDCAVVNGFYREISDALKRQPEPIRSAAAARWWCHNHPGRACRGNLDNLAAAPPGGDGAKDSRQNYEDS